MAHIILTGCTGTAGSAVLARCIESSTISTVSVLSRRPVKQAAGHDKVKVILHQDFTSYPTQLLEEQLKGATACIWALGIASGSASPRYVYILPYNEEKTPILLLCAFLRFSFSDLLCYSDYKKITLDYPLAAAKAFASLNPLFNFVYVSGEGVC